MKSILLLLKISVLLTVLGVVGAAVLVGGAYVYVEPDLPSTENLRDVRFQVPLRVYSADGLLIGEFGEKRRYPVAIDAVPESMVQAFLAAEDDRFFSHPGVDYKALVRAAVQLVLTGQRAQGGSTITMQVARNFYLTRDKTFARKIAEIFLALQIEQTLSKADILELYLNKIYLGQRAYGVTAAAQVYYGKTLAELTLAETAMIAGLPKAPSAYNPLADPQRALERRGYVLGRMRGLGFITEPDFDAAMQAPITAQADRASIELEAGYVAEMVRAALFERVGEAAYTEGFTVTTTVRADLQAAAVGALRSALHAYDERHGFRGVEQHIDLATLTPEQADRALAELDRIGDTLPALITAIEGETLSLRLSGIMEEAQLTLDDLSLLRPYMTADQRGRAPDSVAQVLQVGDVIRIRPRADAAPDAPERWRLAQVPAVAGAIVAVSPADGAVLALSGGYDFTHSKFNRATQAQRQPGSVFKPFIYSAALDAGFTPASLINDAPVVFEDSGLEDYWRPKNYSGKFYGPTPIRVALTKSRNLVSIRLLRSVGIQRTLDHVSRFGFDPATLPRSLSLALGSGSLTLMEILRGYAVLANGGYGVQPYVIDSVRDADGRPVSGWDAPGASPSCDQCDEVVATSGAASPERTSPQGPRVLDESNRFLMYSMMQDVVRRGTARAARSLQRTDLAGKTGTTNDQRDAWFVGFNQGMAAGVWVGFDDNSELGRREVGGRAALPAWIDFMEVALADIPDQPPAIPDGVVTLRIDPETGMQANTANAIYEYFPIDNTPPKLAVQTTSPGAGHSTPSAAPVSAVRQQVEDLF